MAEYHIVVTLPGTMEQLTRTASGRLTIGRSDTCDVFLNYPTISRPHAEIDCDEAGRFTVRDLASHNGTSVNGRVLHDEAAEVRGPATVHIGPCVITLLPVGTTEDTVTASIEAEPAAPRLRLDRGRRALLFGDRVVIERLSNLEFRCTT
jgi:predicted component of type VI protein secretion system